MGAYLLRNNIIFYYYNSFIDVFNKLYNIGFTTHKTGTVQFEFTTRREKTIMAKQLELYNLSLKDNLYKYVKNEKFKN